MRWIGSLLLLGALAQAGEPREIQDRIAALASEDFAVRRHALRWLQANAKRSRPALEQALESEDAEIRTVCRHLLLKLGWIDPVTLKAVTPEQLARLRSADPEERKRAAMKVALSSRMGLEGLQAVYRGHVARLRLEPALRTVFAEFGSLPLRVTNVGRRPGWVGYPQADVETSDWKPFGRRASFPFPVPLVNQTIGLGGICGCGFGGRPAVINQAHRFQWLEPGRALGGRQVNATTYTLNIGHGRGRIKATFHDRAFELMSRNRLPRTTIQVDCPESADAPDFEMFAIPVKKSWGAKVESTRLEAFLRKGRILLRLSSDDGKSLAPKDFSSTWYVVLDGKHQVLEHGTLDGGKPAPRAYKHRELAKAQRLEHAVPLPKRRGVAMLFGTTFTRGSPDGALVVSNRLLIPR
ncbi:MAG: HEAT repeat domain-containing protein [Planctomycetota bacterium]|jgi:hypothetical protein